ncbi:MAG: hypothetical protein JRH20_24955 [Deltaproteobacteria bacterium]|nr:hypothetical protein [Deltaproteobacteria bacterium]
MSKKKTLCKHWQDDKVLKKLKNFRKIVGDPTHVCRRCARVAAAENYLCKPVSLDD